MTIKYAPVFGDQSLFDNAPEYAVFVRYGKESYIFKESMHGYATGSLRDVPIIAMRRIIKTPTWTRADQEAGVLPPVGCKYLAGSDNRELECLYNDATGNVWGFDSEGAVSGYALGYCRPIETPAEKAKRLEEEWVNKAWSETAVFAGVTQDEHDRLRIHLRHIYRAQLSGELKAPTNE